MPILIQCSKCLTTDHAPSGIVPSDWEHFEGGYRSFDLCPDCKKMFDHWVLHRPEVRNDLA